MSKSYKCPLILGRCPYCDSTIYRSEVDAKIYILDSPEDCVCTAVKELSEAQALCAQPREQTAIDRRKALSESRVFNHS